MPRFIWMVKYWRSIELVTYIVLITAVTLLNIRLFSNNMFRLIFEFAACILLMWGYTSTEKLVFMIFFGSLEYYQDPEDERIRYFYGTRFGWGGGNVDFPEDSHWTDPVEKITGVTITHPSGVVFGCASPLRHHHVILGMSLLGVAGLRNTRPSSQGFVTNYGRVVNREDAKIIAIESGQYDRIGGNADDPDLYSEDVWHKSIVRGSPDWKPQKPIGVAKFLVEPFYELDSSKTPDPEIPSS